MLTPYITKGEAMHVLPLPFGMALALLPRREARIIRPPRRAPLVVRRGPSARDRVMADLRYTDVRQHLL
jgi:hypothetical protein